ncbi:MAG: right-handed parallel beta-helix repeat-containing protein [Candidatus Krumholzibacteria bacterium]|nr:right-handed parallel beta-helix repeat-containing protein [Candidatus Krumholzibacteria bacterium]
MLRRRLFHIFLIMALAICLPGLGRAATLHVGPGQTYATIQAAIDAANPLDQIVVHDGIYVENLVINQPLAITSSDFLTFGQNDGAVLDASDIASTLHGIEVNSPGVSIRGLSIHSALGMTADYLEYRAGIVLRADGCTVTNNRLGWDEDHENSLGIWLDDADNTLLDENEIMGVMHGIWMQNSRACTVSGNDVHGAGNASYSGGLYIMGDYAAPDPGADDHRSDPSL